MTEPPLSPVDFKTKVDELRALIVEKLVEIEEDANWGDGEEREELANALEKLVVQAEAMHDVLQEGE